MPMLAWNQMLRLGVIVSPKCHAMTVTRGFCIGFYSEGAATKLASFDLYNYYDSLNSKMQLFRSSLSKNKQTIKTTSNNNIMTKNTESEVASKTRREMHRRKEKRQRRPENRTNKRID